MKVSTVDDFFDKGTFIPAEDKMHGKDTNPSYVNMHDDYETIQDVYDRNVKKYGKVYVYTLVDGEGRSIILLKGKHIVNRLGYYMTLEDIEFKDGELEM